MSPIVKDRLILFGWIAGLLLAAALIWSLSFNYRAAALARSVNRALDAADDARVIDSILPRSFAKSSPMGFWFRLDESDSLFFVFVIMNEGVLVPCGVEIDRTGKAVDVVPLGSHARQVIERIPQGIIQIYLRRIESAASAGGAVSAVKGAE
jgi:hypothetical protein